MYTTITHKPVIVNIGITKNVKIQQDIEVSVTGELKASDLCYAVLKAVANTTGYNKENTINMDPAKREKLNFIAQFAKRRNLRYRLTNSKDSNNVSISFYFHIKLVSVKCDVLDLHYIQDVFEFTFNVRNTKIFIDIEICKSDIGTFYTEVNHGTYPSYNDVDGNDSNSYQITNIEVRNSNIESMILNPTVDRVDIVDSNVIIFSDYMVYTEGYEITKEYDNTLPKKVIDPCLTGISEDMILGFGNDRSKDIYREIFEEARLDFNKDRVSLGIYVFRPESSLSIDDKSSVLFVNNIFNIGCFLQSQIYKYYNEDPIKEGGVAYTLIPTDYLKYCFSIKNFSYRVPFNVKDTSIAAILDVLDKEDSIERLPFPGSEEQYYLSIHGF